MKRSHQKEDFYTKLYHFQGLPVDNKQKRFQRKHPDVGLKRFRLRPRNDIRAEFYEPDAFLNVSLDMS